MLFRFLILSDEVDDFRLDIVIDSEATFHDLHNTILDAIGYAKDQMTSFFICDDDWSKKTEITLIEMDTSSDVDIYIMESTPLDELLEDEQQKLLYVFDYLTERAFFMELREIITGQSSQKPVVKRLEGIPPAQFVTFDDTDLKMPTSTEIGEDFYGDTAYDLDELDESGFEGLTDDNTISFDDERF